MDLDILDINTSILIFFINLSLKAQKISDFMKICRIPFHLSFDTSLNYCNSQISVFG